MSRGAAGPNPHTRTRQRQAARDHRAATERQILDATRLLLEQHPFHELGVQDVMESTGLTRTAFYRYFPDLEAVLLRLLMGIADELVRAEADWFDPAEPIGERLRGGAMAMAKAYQRHGPLVRAIGEAAVTSPEIDFAWRKTFEQIVARRAAAIEQLNEAGVTDVADPEQTTRALMWMTIQYLRETYGRDQTLPVETAAHTLADIWTRSVVAEHVA